MSNLLSKELSFANMKQAGNVTRMTSGGDIDIEIVSKSKFVMSDFERSFKRRPHRKTHSFLLSTEAGVGQVKWRRSRGFSF